MAARRTKKSTKKASSKKPTTSVQPAVPKKDEPAPEKDEELEALKAELREELAATKREREAMQADRHLERINREKGVAEAPAPEAAPSETEAERVARQRQEAREERRRKREEALRASPPATPSNVASLDEARAKKTPADKGSVVLPLPELHKWKLSALNRNYADSMKKLKEPLIQKYNQLLQAELNELAQKDEECVKAQQEQAVAINELIKLLDDQLPEGYAITQILGEKGQIVAQYVPDRAGKPLPLPELAPKGE